MKMTEERAALRRRRMHDPLEQSEVKKFESDARWDIGSYATIPDDSSKLMKDIFVLAREIALLAAFIDYDRAPSRYSMDEMEALAILAGVDAQERAHWSEMLPESTLEVVLNGKPVDPGDFNKTIYNAPRRPAPNDYSSEGYKARDERTKFLMDAVDDAVMSQVSRRYSKVPSWIPNRHQHRGWLLAVDRLVDAISELRNFRKPAIHMLKKVKAHVDIFETDTPSSEILLPSGASGGRPQIADRRYLQDMASHLIFPGDFYPEHDFEPWTFAELSKLFAAMGFKQYGNVAAAKELMNPILKKRRKRRFHPFFKGPHRFFPPQIRTIGQGSN